MLIVDQERWNKKRDIRSRAAICSCQRGLDAERVREQHGWKRVARIHARCVLWRPGMTRADLLAAIAETRDVRRMANYEPAFDSF